MFKNLTKRIVYWGITLACHSLAILTWLPYRWQMRAGKWIGILCYHCAPKLKKIATINIQTCFPELTARDQSTLIRDNFVALGRGLFEALLAAYASERRLAKLIGQVTGVAELIETLQKGQGAIILFPHFIPMYLVGRLLLIKEQIPVSLMYHAPRNKALNDFFLYHLRKFCLKIFNRQDIGLMVKHLRQGHLVWYAPDLDIGHKRSMFIPFFKTPAATLSATLRIATLSHAKVFPIQFFRRDDLSGYDIQIFPPLHDFPTGDAYHDLSYINQMIERSIRAKPEQYLWIYKRFSTRPPGEVKWY